MRIAALDLGSNSFHALIADVERSGRLSVVERAKRMPRIGEAIFRTGAISEVARRNALRALDELLPVIERNRPDAVHAVARAVDLIPADGPGSSRVGRDTLRALIDRLAPLSLAARRRTPALDPGRIDLIVHGAVVLDAILAAAGVDAALVCRAALR